MMLTPGLRKAALTTHVTTSVGWLGSVVAFLALAIAGLVGTADPKVRAAYLAMELLARWVIVPLCLASLASGVVQGLGTQWGLFRHHWVVIKLVITALATLLLFVHLTPIGHMARFAEHPAPFPDELGRLRLQLAVDAGLAVVALVVTTTLSVFKPRGLTRYGRRKQSAPG